MEIRPLTPQEQKYTYAQSMQLEGQTANIGYLRGDFAHSGYGFYTTWFDTRTQWKTDEFKAELDEVINTLREDKGLLHNRYDMSSFAKQFPDSAFQGNYCTEYGFRADTEKHAFLLRCNPTRGDYNFYCFCYVKKWLDKHIANAEHGIRFIDPNYKELFRIPDGGKIVITTAWGEKFEQVCRYIDETHMELSSDRGGDIYHICEFAERMERNNSTVVPVLPNLPEQCYIYLPTTQEIGIVKKGESGYYRSDLSTVYGENGQEFVDELNRQGGVSKAQAAAMKSGSMFGWHTPAADPKNYDGDGKPIKPKHRNKDYER